MNRREWAKRWPNVCWVCGRAPDWRGMQTQHVERRSHGGRGREEAHTNLLRTCAPCHETVLATMPHAEQLAIVLAVNPGEFDLQVWLRIRDPYLRAPNRVTQDEVFGFLVKYAPIGERIRRILGRTLVAAEG